MLQIRELLQIRDFFIILNYIKTAELKIMMDQKPLKK